jgi:hypothetical protein
MNNKPTPRTDAVMQDPLRDGNDLPELARQLENELSEALRERDEAIRERKMAREDADFWHKLYKQLSIY